MDQSNSVGADDLAKSSPDSFDELAFLVWQGCLLTVWPGLGGERGIEKFPDEVGQYLRVGVRREIPVAVADQLIFERLVIFDDAVVDERQAAAGVKMGVRVLIGRFAVGGPASMAD